MSIEELNKKATNLIRSNKSGVVKVDVTKERPVKSITLKKVINKRPKRW